MGRSQSHSLHQTSTGDINLDLIKSRNSQAPKQPKQFKRSLKQLEPINECQAKDQDNEKNNDLGSYVNGNTPRDANARCSKRETTKVLLNTVGDINSSSSNSNSNNNDQPLGDSGEFECKQQNSKPTRNLLTSKLLNSSSQTTCCCGAAIQGHSYLLDTTKCCPLSGKDTPSSLIGSTTVDRCSNNNNLSNGREAQIKHHKQKEQKTRETVVLNSLSEAEKLFYKPHLKADDFNSSLAIALTPRNLTKFSIPINNYMDYSSNHNNNNDRISRNRNSNRCADDSDDFTCCALSVSSPSPSSSSLSSESFIPTLTPAPAPAPDPVREIKSSHLDLSDGSNKLQKTRQQTQLCGSRQFYHNDNYDQAPENSITEQVGWISRIQASKLDYSNSNRNQNQNRHEQQQHSKLKSFVHLPQPNQASSAGCCSYYSRNQSKCLFKSNNHITDLDGPIELTQVSGECGCGARNRGDKNRYSSTFLDNNNAGQPYADYLRKTNNNNSHQLIRINDQHRDSPISERKLNRNHNHIDNNKYQILISSTTSELSPSSPSFTGKSSSILHEQDIDKTLDQVEGFYQSKTQLLNHLDWKGAAKRYREMPRQHRGQFWWRMRQSCFCHTLFSTIYNLFPILSSFKRYSFPGDLLTDLMAGFTIAILHIPQGMAYGMLSGVEPIYGLYVSFIPVLIMALMSKSLHVSYGTFAVVSMLLANSVESVKLALKQQHQQLLSSQTQQKSINSLIETSSLPPSSISDQPTAAPSLSDGIPKNFDGLVLTNNHQPSNPSQRILNNLLAGSTASNLDINNQQVQQPFIDLSNNLSTISPLASTGDNGLWTFDVDGGEFSLPSSIEILTSICLLTGMIQIFMSLARLGVLSLMFSDQLVSGFTTASAINVVTSQIAAVFDLSLPIVPEGLFKMCRIWFAFGNKLTEGFNQYTAVLSLVSIVFLLAVKEIIEPILRKRHKSFTCLPSELVLMSVIIFSSWYWQFETNYDIKIVGTVPTGLPEPAVPRLDIAPLIYQDAITVALISFAMNLSLAQVYAKKFRYTLNPNQELFALGASNMVGSFFNCFPCASSLSRSAIQSNLNVKSQICSLFSCALVVSIICYFAPILHDLPRSTLSCIIIVALKGILIQIKDLYSNWRLSKLDALVWIATFMSVIALGITYGLILGIVASLFMVFFR